MTSKNQSPSILHACFSLSLFFFVCFKANGRGKKQRPCFHSILQNQFYPLLDLSTFFILIVLFFPPILPPKPWLREKTKRNPTNKQQQPKGKETDRIKSFFSFFFLLHLFPKTRRHFFFFYSTFFFSYLTVNLFFFDVSFFTFFIFDLHSTGHQEKTLDIINKNKKKTISSSSVPSLNHSTIPACSVK